MLPAIHLWTVRQGNDVECRYNFAAGRFHTKKLCSRLLSTEVEFYWQKQQNHGLCNLWGLRGNVHGSSMALWKARG